MENRSTGLFFKTITSLLEAIPSENGPQLSSITKPTTKYNRVKNVKLDDGSVQAIELQQGVSVTQYILNIKNTQ